MYTITKSGTIRRDSDSASIPQDSKNRDYRKYLSWLDAGNTPKYEPVPDPTVEMGKYSDSLLSQPENRVLFKALFKQENRLRALEGLLPLTEAEYVDIAKASYFEEV